MPECPSCGSKVMGEAEVKTGNAIIVSIPNSPGQQYVTPENWRDILSIHIPEGLNVEDLGDIKETGN